MTDIVDRANEQAQRILDEALSNAKLAAPNDTQECIGCDKAIGANRKQAMPSATRCIDCQTKYEKVR